MQTPQATASLPTLRQGAHCTKALRPLTRAVWCAVRFSTLLGYRGQLLVLSGMASLRHATAQGPSFFAVVFMSIGNVGGGPSCVTPTPR